MNKIQNIKRKVYLSNSALKLCVLVSFSMYTKQKQVNK